MKALIEEINDKLKTILTELESQKREIDDSLVSVQEKIDEKIEEAKVYKNNVDLAKGEINRLENEIESLEDDLKDITTRFSNKDLNAILETANKEINLQITSRQKEIDKEKDKIAEYTKQAQMIKDLLINLKKDKESKKFKLENITKVSDYYSKELNNIVNFSSENPDNLAEKEPEIEREEVNNKEPYVFNNEPIVDDKPIFDAIESIEKENEEELEEVKKDDESNLDDFKLFEANDTAEINDELDNENKIDFKALNDSIDKEYENIFGTTIEPQTVEEEEEKKEAKEGPVEEVKESPTENANNNFDFNFENGFALTEDDLNEVSTSETKDSNEIDTFFSSNGLDFNKFNEENKEKIRKNFNLVDFTKTLDILRKNNIILDYIYNAVDIFKVSHNELESIINKLLLSGQSTKNISYVLNALPLINSVDLQEVIDSYKETIKDANITDLVIKAKHLNELGGGN